MSISSVSTAAAVLPPVPAQDPTLQSAAADSEAVAPDPAPSSSDTVSLSPTAQQSLAAAPPADAQPAQPDALQAAVAALNDTSGDTSIADQLQAYGLVVNTVANGSSANTTPADATAATAALYNSPFAQHAQQLLTTIGGMMDWSGGDKTADSIDNALAAFQGLSAADQQIYVGAVGLQHQLVSGETPITSVEDYTANQEARADVERALQAAESDPAYASQIANGVAQGFYGARDRLGVAAAAAGDQATAALVKLSQTKPDTADWTQQVQAFFAQNGPAPAGPAAGPTPITGTTTLISSPAIDGDDLATALAAVNDTSGKTSFADQMSAYSTLSNYMRTGQDYGPARTAVVQNASASAFFVQVERAASQFNAQSIGLARSAAANGSAVSGTAQLALLNRLSDTQQQMVFAGTAPSYSSLDAWKAEMGGGATPTTQTSNSGSVGSAAKGALAALISSNTPSSSADIALSLLQSAAKANAAVETDDEARRPVDDGASAKDTANVASYGATRKAGATLSVVA